MEKWGYRYPVSLLAIEVYSLASEKAGDDDQLLYDALVTTVTTVCKIHSPLEEDLHYFVERLQDLTKELTDDKSVNEPKNKKPKRSFGSAYLQYLNGLSIDSVILKMTGYNLDAARKLYCDMDRGDVTILVDQFISGKIESNMVSMEAAMYGFGGSYEGGKKGQNESSYELNSAEGLSALRGLGF